jgi:hypothetical protein
VTNQTISVREKGSSVTDQTFFMTNQTNLTTNQTSSMTEKVSSVTNQTSSMTNQTSFVTNQTSFVTNQTSFVTDGTNLLVENGTSVKKNRPDQIQRPQIPSHGQTNTRQESVAANRGQTPVAKLRNDSQHESWRAITPNVES